jgi:hypothetical protein
VHDVLEPSVNIDALRDPRPPSRPDTLQPLRPGSWPVILLVTLTAGLIGGGLWWNRTVTADPELRFDGAANVFRTQDGDKSGIHELRNTLGTEVQIDFVPGDRFFAYVDLYNGGHHDIHVDAIPPAGFHYFGLERVLLSSNRNSPFEAGYGPLRPFTLHRGETRYLRLHFRLADCDPAGLQDGATTIQGLPVSYDILGFRRTVSVPFPSMAIAVQTIGTCNHPILDRT